MPGYYKLAEDNYVAKDQLWVNAYFARKKSAANYSNTTKPLKVAVACWDLSHNAAGRAVNLADLCQLSGIDVSLIGAIFHKTNTALWKPLTTISYPLHYFVADKNNLYTQIRDFVLAHHYDVLIVSKPRLVNLLFALLYKLIWGTAIVFDIDDEELGFVQNNKPIKLDEVLSCFSDKLHQSKSVTSDFWTRLSVGMATMFDSVTVSNPALQQRYGGVLLPHLRDANRFKPVVATKYSDRAKLGIADEDIVVLFFGTPRRRKGLLEAAEAIAAVANKHLVFLIAGDFPDADLKKELQAFSQIRYVFLPDQPYDKAEKIVNLGDICILMQDVEDIAAQFQLPAKLIDALAVGLKLFIRETPAICNLIDPAFYIAVTEQTLPEKLASFLAANFNKDNAASYAALSHQYFSANFSMQANAALINELLVGAAKNRYQLPLQPFWPALTYKLDMESLLSEFIRFRLCSAKNEQHINN